MPRPSQCERQESEDGFAVLGLSELVFLRDIKQLRSAVKPLSSAYVSGENKLTKEKPLPSDEITSKQRRRRLGRAPMARVWDRCRRGAELGAWAGAFPMVLCYRTEMAPGDRPPTPQAPPGRGWLETSMEEPRPRTS